MRILDEYHKVFRDKKLRCLMFLLIDFIEIVMLNQFISFFGICETAECYDDHLVVL